MYNSKLFGTILFLTITLLAGCKDPIEPDNETPNTYIVGWEINTQEISIAKLWKNGIPQNLTDGTSSARAYSVFVAGSNVYIAGYENSGQLNESIFGNYRSSVAKLWKNGVAQNLTDGTTNAVAKAVYVSGNDVYVTGTVGNVVTLWTNGVAQNLSDGTYHVETNSIFVLDNNVYIAGTEQIANSKNYNIATLWSNGVAQSLTNGYPEAFASSVYVSGKDEYVVGHERIFENQIGSVSSKPIAKLWINGVAENLIDNKTASYANSIYISGDDVYIAGFVFGSGAIIWKNGVMQKLSDNASANSVYISDDNVYVAGYNKNGAALWINGILQELAGNSPRANAICVFVE
jgi:hypothetical protein